MDPYGTLFRTVLHPAWESVLRGRPTLPRLRMLQRTQWLSRDELVAFQMNELRKLLRHAEKNVPYYRDRMGDAGVRADDVVYPDDLRKVPLLTRSDASTTLEARTSTAPPFPSIRKTTSGSSGNPLVFAYDEDSEYWRKAMKWRGYEWAGYQAGDTVLHYWGPPPKPLPPVRQRIKIAVDRMLRREVYFDCVTQSEEHLRRAVDLIRSKKPKSIVCYAQSGAGLARFIVENELRDWDTIPVIAAAEPLLPSDRAMMEAAFGPAVFNTYGCRETMLIAAECEQHDGLHTSMENIFVEVLVTEPDGTKRPAREGEVGEVAITDLHNYGAPFIRYVNGDLATAGPDRICACGRALTRVHSIEGRVNEAFVDGRGGRVNGMYFCTIMVPLAQEIRRYQAIQHKDQSITLRLVPTDKYNERTARILEDNVTRAIPGVPLKIELVDFIPPASSGKGRPVVVER